MKGTIVSARYAKSLLELAVEQGKLDDVYADMQHIADVCGASHELSLLLKSPIVKQDKKSAILDEVFGSNISEVTAKFVQLLTAKGRESVLEEVSRAFINQYKLRNSIATAVVTTAIALSDDDRAKIVKLVEESTSGHSVEIEERVDESIIGGIVIRVGDRQVDASIKRKLMTLSQTFNKNLYVADF